MQMSKGNCEKGYSISFPLSQQNLNAALWLPASPRPTRYSFDLNKRSVTTPAVSSTGSSQRISLITAVWYFTLVQVAAALHWSVQTRSLNNAEHVFVHLLLIIASFLWRWLNFAWLSPKVSNILCSDWLTLYQASRRGEIKRGNAATCRCSIWGIVTEHCPLPISSMLRQFVVQADRSLHWVHSVELLTK